VRSGRKLVRGLALGAPDVYLWVSLSIYMTRLHRRFKFTPQLSSLLHTLHQISTYIKSQLALNSNHSTCLCTLLLGYLKELGYVCSVTCSALLLLITAQYEFVKQISEDSKNLVVGLVRDKFATEKKMLAELGERSNVHILHADLTSHASLKQAAADTAEIVGDRGVDYLVANGAFPSHFDAYRPIGAL
jgi:hypothetical protein